MTALATLAAGVTGYVVRRVRRRVAGAALIAGLRGRMASHRIDDDSLSL